ncbi:MAG TPA: hypothetical protein VEI82_08585, partial [Myxococcota bacterium]|nr:hypothetical protein [Myxococcota bacterium]
MALVAAAAAVADVRADGVWTDRTIDSVRQFSLGGSALHIDPGGHPHVFVGGDRVYHDWFDGSAWQREIVDPKARSGDSLQSAIGPSGDLHVVYQRSTPGGANPMAPALVSQPPTSQLFYATNLSGAWVVQQIPTPSQSAAPGIVSGLVVDANHAPHFLIGVPGVFHETLQNGTWSWEPVADVTNYASSQTKGSDQPPQLAIDASGDLHAILYLATSGPNPRLDYAKRDATGWHN